MEWHNSPTQTRETLCFPDCPKNLPDFLGQERHNALFVFCSKIEFFPTGNNVSFGKKRLCDPEIPIWYSAHPAFHWPYRGRCRFANRGLPRLDAYNRVFAPDLNQIPGQAGNDGRGKPGMTTSSFWGGLIGRREAPADFGFHRPRAAREGAVPAGMTACV